MSYGNAIGLKKLDFVDTFWILNRKMSDTAYFFLASAQLFIEIDLDIAKMNTHLYQILKIAPRMDEIN